ncbi:metallo-mystery pair system four-Cys motif protein [Dolichospermum sp. ST_sed9]|nr:metallo-mystery pair system four-Cys motif protein [Dolichospermum sp. ST_sed9]
MKRQLLLTSATIAGIILAGNFGGVTKTFAQTSNNQEVKINFQGKVGKQPFECGKTYILGKPATKVTPDDFRFYISDIALIDNNGKSIPVNLTQDGKWQYQNVALLDFENKSGGCANGTVETRNQIVGTIPKGNYQGLQFTLGVPLNLNHADSVTAPSPLNLTSLWWNWLFGYKFARLDWKTQTHNSQVKHGEKNEKAQGFPIHLGSTGCQAIEGSKKPSTCSNLNTSKVIFTKFDINKNVVTADHYQAGGRTIHTGDFAGTGSTNPFKSEFISGFKLSEAEKQDLLAFLRSLTDDTVIKTPAFSNPYPENIK